MQLELERGEGAAASMPTEAPDEEPKKPKVGSSTAAGARPPTVPKTCRLCAFGSASKSGGVDIDER